jgi:hypothetical protein
MVRFWFRHHCLVQERHGFEGLSKMFSLRMVELDPKHMPTGAICKMGIREGEFSLTFTEVRGLPFLQRCIGDRLNESVC